jgi:uncharacterized SAM-binding protein YcdF (DUF218 family)
MRFVMPVIEFLTTPSMLFLTLGLAALLALLVGWRRGAILCLSCSLGGFVGFGVTSLSEVMVAPLVTRFPPVDLDRAAPPFGLIVVGAGLNELTAEHTGALMDLEDGGEAVPIVALLARRYPDARIIVSSGHGGPYPAAPLRAVDGARRVLTAFGVDENRIRIDPDAATTFMHAENTLALVGPDRDKTWWVITPAHRMPRLIGVYRHLGFEPVPYPVDFQWIPPFSLTYFYDLTAGLALTDIGAKEWRGLLLYYLTGRIDSLFPGPQPPGADGLELSQNG